VDVRERGEDEAMKRDEVMLIIDIELFLVLVLL
jgi:hypothetical protein